MEVSMSGRLARRAFLTRALAAPSALVVGFDPDKRSWVMDGSSGPGVPRGQTAPDGGGRPLEGLPRLAGRVSFDEASLDAAALDNGNIVHRQPRAVLQPASVEDIVAMVRYANRHGLHIAMRGQGHSVYGQTHAEAGIVVDSSTLDRVLHVASDSVDAQAGATWAALNRVTVEKGLTPAVMPDTMTLTVGGGVSVGTWGHTSHRFGGLVDMVSELDVVTGEGQLVTCSSQREPELFEMVLAGLGQCALIVRARVRLVRAPDRVVRQNLVYEDLDAFYADQQRLVEDGRFEHLEGRFMKDSGGRWRPRIEVGSFSASTDAELAELQRGLRFASRDAAVRRSYPEYLETKSFVPLPAEPPERDEMRASRRNPSIVGWLPLSAGQSFIEAHVLGSAAALGDTWVVASSVMDTTRFTRPLFKMPDERLAVSFWLFRSAPVDDRRLFEELLASGGDLIDRMRTVGGKRYPPYGLVRAQSEWEEHYGPDVWQRLVRAKRQFDPNNVLTPGPGIFTSPPDLKG
ncbi:MAG: FAD-binding protein [Luteitalea sp.]|nr:FAD-binding protein [Luteitalea sp.]